MPRKDDIRFDKRPVKVDHKSARGTVFRNFGAFTRGSQLVRMRYTVMLDGFKWPAITALGSFAVLLILLLALLMREHEIQLVEMRLFAGFWQLVGLDPSHMINLTLPDDTIEPMQIGDVPDYPEVARAVTKFIRCIIVAVAGSAALTTPLATWFVNLSQQTSDDTMEDRHERGATLVENGVLASEVAAHNAHEFAAELADRYPDLDPKQVAERPIAERVGLGLHVPYTIAGIPYPWRFEQTHAMLIGSTGTGKTTILKSLVTQARERGHRCVIFDLTGTFVESFYREKTDFILNTMDERCPPWTLFDECENYADYMSAAAALIPGGDGSGEDPFWVAAARTLFVEMCAKLVATGHTTNRAIVQELMTSDLEALCTALVGSIAAPLVNPKAPRLAESVRAVFNTNALAMRFLPDPVRDGRKPFSIRRWVEGEAEPGSILFITSTLGDLVLSRTLMTLWVDLAVNSLLMTRDSRDLRMWFMFDEVHALHRLQAVEHGLQTARSFGGAFVLGMHSFDKLAETYGEKGANNLASLARTKVLLSTGDKHTATFASDIVGEHEVREIDEAYSIGATKSRDAATITPRTSIKSLMLAADMVNMPSMSGILKFPEGFPAGHVTVKWVKYPAVAPKFMRKRTMPIAGLLQPRAAEDQSEAADSGPQMRAESEIAVEVPTRAEPSMRPGPSPDLFSAMNVPIAPSLAKPAPLKVASGVRAATVDGTVAPSQEARRVLDSFRSPRTDLGREEPNLAGAPTGPVSTSPMDKASLTGTPGTNRQVQQISIEELTGQAYGDPSEKKGAERSGPDHERDDHGREDDGMGLDS